MPFTHNELETLITSSGDIDAIVTQLGKIKPYQLALLKADGTEVIKVLLSNPKLNPFWENQFNSLRIDITELLTTGSFQFRDPSPQSKADFYCGYQLYLAALKAKSKPDKFDLYIKQAIKSFNCFFAHRVVLTDLINAHQDCNKDELNECVKKVQNHVTQLEQFKTPGFLVLAITYYYLATFYQNGAARDESIKCYQLSWKYLHLAELLEPFSDREIHNAYFGQGIALSNTIKATSIAQLKEAMLSVAKELLPASVRVRLEAEALTIASILEPQTRTGPSAAVGGAPALAEGGSSLRSSSSREAVPECKDDDYKSTVAPTNVS